MCSPDGLMSCLLGSVSKRPRLEVGLKDRLQDELERLAEDNDGAPGVDGVTFAAIEAQGVEAFLGQIRGELVERTYKPLPVSGSTLFDSIASELFEALPTSASRYCRGDGKRKWEANRIRTRTPSAPSIA